MRILISLCGLWCAATATAIDLALPPANTNFVSQIVAQGEGYQIQALRFPFAGLERSLRRGEAAQVGHVLLHTRLKTGQGREMLRTKTTREWRTRVGGFWHNRIAGVAKDAERLYVAVWSARGRGLAPTFLLPAERRPANSPRYHSALEVRVFALADGRLLHKAAVPGAPAAVPPETAAGPGPLKVGKAGVDCHGTRLRFEGTKLKPGDAKR